MAITVRQVTEGWEATYSLMAKCANPSPPAERLQVAVLFLRVVQLPALNPMISSFLTCPKFNTPCMHCQVEILVKSTSNFSLTFASRMSIIKELRDS